MTQAAPARALALPVVQVAEARMLVTAEALRTDPRGVAEVRRCALLLVRTQLANRMRDALTPDQREGGATPYLPRGQWHRLEEVHAGADGVTPELSVVYAAVQRGVLVCTDPQRTPLGGLLRHATLPLTPTGRLQAVDRAGGVREFVRYDLRARLDDHTALFWRRVL